MAQKHKTYSVKRADIATNDTNSRYRVQSLLHMSFRFCTLCAFCAFCPAEPVCRVKAIATKGTKTQKETTPKNGKWPRKTPSDYRMDRFYRMESILHLPQLLNFSAFCAFCGYFPVQPVRGLKAMATKGTKTQKGTNQLLGI